MLETLRTRAVRLLLTALMLTPWVASMYLLYWLESAEMWSVDTPHRGKTSVAILWLGMTLTFAAWSFLSRRGK